MMIGEETMPAEDADVEARIARLESDVSHIREDLRDVKTDVRSLRDRMDALRHELAEKIDSARTQALVLYVALAGAMLATMARGFGWI